MEVTSPVGKDGLIEDWEAAIRLWDNCVRVGLNDNPEERPLLFSEPVWATNKHRAKMCESVFEGLGARLSYVMKDAPLACFSVGKSTGLVIDMGHSFTKTIPVNDGYVLKRPVRKSRCNGEFLQNILADHVAKEHKAKFVPKFLTKKGPKPKDISQSFVDFMTSELKRDLKENVVYVRPTDPATSPETKATAKTYELPDGTKIKLSDARFKHSEVYFSRFHDKLDEQFEGLQYLVQGTILACDMDIRRELYSNLVLTGGCSKIQGLRERLAAMIVNIAPPAFQPKLVKFPHNSPLDGILGVWCGGSILGSLGHFQESWIPRSDYDEHGPNLFNRRCA